jgi:hypothetical protein
VDKRKKKREGRKGRAREAKREREQKGGRVNLLSWNRFRKEWSKDKHFYRQEIHQYYRQLEE